MTEFRDMKAGDEIETADKTYRVIGKDRLGRLQLQQVGCFFEVWGCCYISDDYDTWDECAEAMRELMDMYEDDDCDERFLEELEDAEIETHFVGKKFWIHYKDLDKL